MGYLMMIIIRLIFCYRSSIDTNSKAGKHQAQTLLNELCQKIETTYDCLKEQESYDLEKSLDFLCAKSNFQV